MRVLSVKIIVPDILHAKQGDILPRIKIVVILDFQKSMTARTIGSSLSSELVSW